jgi:phosphoserine phosphatase
MTGDLIWMPDDSFEVIYFDVDSTLCCQFEGVDEIADEQGVGDAVKVITTRCMEATGLNVEAYEERLNLIKPTASMIDRLAQKYLDRITPGAKDVISVLQDLGKDVRIISAGIRSSLALLANYLNIKKEKVNAVDVTFNPKGEYLGFDKDSLLVRKWGKRDLIAQYSLNQRTVFIGDGVSDLEAQGTVTRFIGYGYPELRKSVKEEAVFCINSSTLFALLPLVLTYKEVSTLNKEQKNIYTNGLEELSQGNVLIQEGHHVQSGCFR